MPGIELQKREKILVSLAAICALAVAVYHVSQGPLQAYRNAQEELVDARYTLEQARVLEQEVVEARGSRQALASYLEARSSNFDLFTFVNTTLSQAGVLERAQILNTRGGLRGVPQGDFDGVTVTLNGVSMEELIDFVHRIYDSGNLIVLSDLSHLRPASDGRGLDTEMVFFCPA